MTGSARRRARRRRARLDDDRLGLDDDRLDGLEDLDDRLDDDRLGLLDERDRRHRLGRRLDARRELAVEGRRRWRGRSVRLGRRRHLDVPQRPSPERALAELVPADLPADRRAARRRRRSRAGPAGSGASARRTGASSASSCSDPPSPFAHHECADEVAAALEVADADDGSRRDRRMAVENALDVVRAERPAARRDDVLGAADEREVPLLVDVRDVARSGTSRRGRPTSSPREAPSSRRTAWGAGRGWQGRLRCRSAARCPGRR